MSEVNQPPQMQDSALGYARCLPSDVRICKLAIMALVVSVLGSPCILGALSDWINWYVPMQFNQVGYYGYLHQWVLWGAMITATALSLIALARIRLSRGRLLGSTIAWIALGVSLVWWVLPLIIWMPLPH